MKRRAGMPRGLLFAVAGGLLGCAPKPVTTRGDAETTAGVDTGHGVPTSGATTLATDGGVSTGSGGGGTSAEPVVPGYCPGVAKWEGRRTCHNDDDCPAANEICDAGLCESGCPPACDPADVLSCGAVQACDEGGCRPFPCTVDADCACGSCVHGGCWPRPWVCLVP